MAYIGPEPNPGQNREVDDISSSFNGSTTAFTLQVNSQNVSPGSSNAIIVSLGGVVQNPGTDYNIAASTITFTTAPASGLSFFGLVLGQQVDIQSLADGASPTMSAPTITGDLSIADKIVHTGDTNTAIRFSTADTVSIETGGSERSKFDSNGFTITGDALTIGTNGQVPTLKAGGTNTDIRLAAVGTGGFITLATGNSSAVQTDRWKVLGTSGHLHPAIDNAYDIGSSSYRVRNVYTTDLHLSNEGSQNDVDSTWGKYTIQEGFDELFLINHRTGKKFKFNLTEVE